MKMNWWKEFHDYRFTRVELGDGVQDTIFRAFSADEVAAASDSPRQTTNRTQSGVSILEFISSNARICVLSCKRIGASFFNIEADFL